MGRFSMTSKHIVVTRPDSDFTTKYLSFWANRVMDDARQRGHTVIDLVSSRACRHELESVLRKMQPTFVFLNGHGNKQTVTGQENEPLIVEGENEHVLGNTVTYALSCQSAVGLGAAAVQAGARAYIGYSEDFIFMYDTAQRTRPHHDKTAAPFLDSAMRVPQSLIKGNNVQDACDAGKRGFRKHIRKLLTSEASLADSSMIRYLLWDLQHLTAHGDGATVI